MAAAETLAYGPLAAILVVMAGFSAWVFLHSKRSYLLRWLLVPASLAAALCSAQIYDLRLGFAAPAELPARFVYLGHHIVVKNGEKVAIEVWAQTRETRLYRLPYSKPLEQSLQAGSEKGRKGRGPVVMHRRGKEGEGEQP